jgi:hypothetical protein
VLAEPLTDPERLTHHESKQPSERFVSNGLYARHRRTCFGMKIPQYAFGNLAEINLPNERSARRKRNRGKRVLATGCKKGAPDRVCKRRVRFSPLGRDHVKTARPLKETSYEVGTVRRVSTTSRSRPPATDQFMGKFVPRNITFLSSETCIVRLTPVEGRGEGGRKARP